MIRILIADDHAVVRQGVRQVLALDADLLVADEAGDGWQILEKLRSGRFDLLLTDMSMPGPSGVELVRRVKDEHPAMPVLVLSMHGDSQTAARGLKAGASGYVTKDSSPTTLLAAVRKVAGGGQFIEPELAQKLVFETGLGGEAPPHEVLSDREYEVFLMIVQGRNSNDIAEALHLSPKTVSTHKMRLMQKLELESTADLVRYAFKHGLIV